MYWPDPESSSWSSDPLSSWCQSVTLLGYLHTLCNCVSIVTCDPSWPRWRDNLSPEDNKMSSQLISWSRSGILHTNALRNAETIAESAPDISQHHAGNVATRIRIRDICKSSSLGKWKVDLLLTYMMWGTESLLFKTLIWKITSTIGSIFSTK